MHLEILLEEPSAEAALAALLPRIVGDDITWKLYPHQGKHNLLAQLPAKLRAYRSWLPDDWRIVVLLDNDTDDCAHLKNRLDTIAHEAGLTTRTNAAPTATMHILNRIAIEELEAWFFGDIDALRAAYPKLPANLQRREPYRNPDAIRGGTCETLLRELQRAGYYQNLKHLPKIETARSIAQHMHPDRNRSHSFQTFCQGLSTLIAQPKPTDPSRTTEAPSNT